MKKRVLIALAAALSVTLAVVCTAGVLGSAPTSAQETASPAQIGTEPSFAEAAEEGSGRSSSTGRTIVCTGLDMANKVYYRPSGGDPELLSVCDELASGEYTEERLAEIREKYFSPSLEPGWGKSQEMDHLLRYWRVWDQCDTESGLDADKFEEIWKGEKEPNLLTSFDYVAESMPGLTKIQKRAIFLKTKLGGQSLYDYDNLLYAGLVTPETPKLTPEKAKEIIALHQGENSVQAVFEDFLKVQPCADFFRYENHLFCTFNGPAASLSTSAPSFEDLVLFVTQDEDGNAHIIGVGDQRFVFYSVQSAEGELISCEMLQENDPPESWVSSRVHRAVENTSEGSFADRCRQNYETLFAHE